MRFDSMVPLLSRKGTATANLFFVVFVDIRVFKLVFLYCFNKEDLESSDAKKTSNYEDYDMSVTFSFES